MYLYFRVFRLIISSSKLRLQQLRLLTCFIVTSMVFSLNAAALKHYSPENKHGVDKADIELNSDKPCHSEKATSNTDKAAVTASNQYFCCDAGCSHCHASFANSYADIHIGSFNFERPSEYNILLRHIQAFSFLNIKPLNPPPIS